MVIAGKVSPTALAVPLTAGEPVDASDFACIRQQMTLDFFKWDPQVGDVSTLARFPLLLRWNEWRRLSRLAESLDAEVVAAEREVLARPELLSRLGLPRGLRRLLKSTQHVGPTPAAARVMRFDFHWTDDGWRISEVNSDVPGGYTESSSFPQLMCPHFPGTESAGDPGAALADAIARSAGSDQTVALLAATGFLEDQQVTAYLAQRLAERGMLPVAATPRQVGWTDGLAHLHDKRVGAIVRFYQAEWLGKRQDRALFVGGRTPVVNPGTAAITESKRFPLLWDELATPVPAWRSLLPETRDPRQAPWCDDDGWLVKSAYCNTGDRVVIRSTVSPKQWRSASRSVRCWPGSWVAQRRFATVPVDSPGGPVYPCLGIYTIDGRAAGVYGRYSFTPVVDFSAVDVAVLVEREA
jgi:hypothetical protein